MQADDEPNSALYGFNMATGAIELQHPVQLQIAPGALTPYAGDLYGYSGFFGGLFGF